MIETIKETEFDEYGEFEYKRQSNLDEVVSKINEIIRYLNNKEVNA